MSVQPGVQLERYSGCRRGEDGLHRAKDPNRRVAGWFGVLIAEARPLPGFPGTSDGHLGRIRALASHDEVLTTIFGLPTHVVRREWQVEYAR
jgi:hypothetical protein